MIQLTERQFEKYLKMSIQNYGAAYIDISDEWNLPHTFSPAFETTMNDAIQTLEKTSSKSKIRLFSRVASTDVLPTFGRPNIIKLRGSCVAAGILLVGNSIDIN